MLRIESPTACVLRASYSTSVFWFSCLSTDLFLTLPLLCSAEADSRKLHFPGCAVQWLPPRFGQREAAGDRRVGGRKKSGCVSLFPSVRGQVSRKGWVSSEWLTVPLLDFSYLLTPEHIASCLDLSSSRSVNNFLLLLISGMPHHPFPPITHSSTFVTCAPY